MRLDHSQAEAAAFGQGPCMVLAGPGSGKTFTITSRIAYLTDQRQVRPENILVITFTRYAAAQMQLRFQDACEGRRLPVTFGTFHSIYFQILKKTYSLTQENVLTGKEKKLFLHRAAAAALEGTSGKPEAGGSGSADLDREDFLRLLETEIGRVKNEDMDPEEYRSACCGPALFRQIFLAYEEEKKKQGKLDFEDMLTRCRDFLTSHEKIREEWQKKFRYILVDEFQDCNRVQYEVLKLLAGPDRNLFVVGDDDQAIYGFRGASPKIMQTFLLDFPDARQILLDTNYRCDAQIVAGALRVIDQNRDRFPKALHAVHTGRSKEDAADRGIRVMEFKDPREESIGLLTRIRHLLAQGLPAKDIAVLFRTGAEGEFLAEQLSRDRIPFQMKDCKDSLYEHFIGKDVRSYLSLADAPDKENAGTDLLRIANRPNRYLTRESLADARGNVGLLLSYYQGEDRVQEGIRKLYDDLTLIRDEPPYSAIQYIREGIGYDEFLKDYARARHLKPEKYQEVLDQIQDRAKDFSTTGEWMSHVDRFNEEVKPRRKEASGGGIQLLTIHSAKGLEYDTVFLIGANEGVIPHKKAQLPAEIEEERRLFYVAVTRARRIFSVSYVTEKNGRPAAPSRFVEELKGQT